MNTSNFMIGPVIKDGLRKDVKAHAIPEDSFETLSNAYQWRGRIVRRPGYNLLGRLANNTPVMGLRTRDLFAPLAQELIAFDTTDDYFYNSITKTFDPLPSFMPVTWSGTDYQFFFTTNYAGAFWATNSKPGFHGFTVTLFANQSGTGLAAQVNVTAAGNNYVIGDFVYFLNVTGPAAANNLAYGQVTAINVGGNPDVFTVQSLIANTTTVTFVFVNGAATTGSVLSTTASIAGQDGIRYYGDLSYGGAISHTSWANYNPPVNTTDALVGCLLIFPYRGYLVFLNTSEYIGSQGVVQNFGNRARWTQIGTPYYSLPVPNTPNTQTYDAKTARDDLFGRGGANDAPTQEVIVGAAFIKDLLVVYFERSTWRLRFVNNSQNPFVWERVNVELGSDCTFSSIAFDKGLMSIGNRGIVISDGNDTVRFDEKIPNEIFDIRQNNHGLDRVYGIRTFRTKLNYWTYPSGNIPDGIYPDQVLVYNYETKNWSFFDDSFTCFGYLYPANTGFRWIDLPKDWPSYNNYTVTNGVTEGGFETIIAGNQQGFVLILEQTSAQNDPSLFISAITLPVGTTPTLITSPNNNLLDGDWIALSGVTGTTGTDGVSLNGRNFKVSNPTGDANDFSITEFEPVDGGIATGTSYSYNIDFMPILEGSVQINVGALVFKDLSLDGILTEATGLGSGTIDYATGVINLSFDPAIGATEVYIRVVSLSVEQLIVTVPTMTAYTGDGLIAKISNIDIQTKIFNFFQDDKRSRLSKIDFYVDSTSHGQFTVNVFGDSSNTIINAPLDDNPQSNVVLTYPSAYQISDGDQTIFRLFCDAIAQTVQLQMKLSDRQMAVNSINSEAIEIVSMMFTLRRGGRLL